MENSPTMPPAVGLRPVVPDDLPIFYDHLFDAEANRMAAFTAPIPEDFAAFAARWQRLKDLYATDARTILVDGTVAGHIATYIESGDRELTYWLSREFWGRGVGSASVESFLHVEATRPLFARSAKDNTASRRVLEKNGFRVVGEGSGFSNARGEVVEEFVLRLDGELLEAGER